MALTDSEKERVYYHLGYPQTDANFTVGYLVETPINRQQIFLVYRAVECLTPEAERRVRYLLSQLDSLEEQLEGAPDLFQATRISDINPNQHFDIQIDRLRKRWAFRLADTLAVKPYNLSSRFGAGSGSGTVRVFPMRTL